MRVFSLSILAILIIAAASSCQKEELSSLATSDDFHSSKGHPINKNGILSFRDHDHLRTYFAELNEYLFEEMKEHETDTLLTLLENELNFASLRPILDPDFIPATRSSELVENFLKDEVRMALLNPDYEVEIGDSTYTYFSENTIIQRNNDNTEAGSVFASMEKGDDSFIPREILEQDVKILSKKHLVKKENIPSSDCDLQVATALTPQRCLPYSARLIAAANLRYYVNGVQELAPADGDYFIIWGDGNSTTINNNCCIDITHTYDYPGTYTVQIVFNAFAICPSPIGGINSENYTTSETVSVGENDCEEPNHSKTYHQTVGNYKLRGELWTLHDPFGTSQTAKTTSYEWDNPWYGGPGWYKRKSYVYAKLWYDFRANDCSLWPGDSDGIQTDHHGNMRDIRAAKTRGLLTEIENGPWIPHNEVKAYFEIQNSGNTLGCNCIIEVCE